MIEEVLKQRKETYGSFKGHAEISQSLKSAMKSSPNWGSMKSDQRESLEMIQHKIARILNGDPDYSDSYLDIAGYAMLIFNDLTQEGEK